jgi:bacteriocin-like protein
MKNLETLSKKDLKSINGGIAWWAAAIIGNAVYDLIKDPKECSSSFSKGFNSTFK